MGMTRAYSGGTFDLLHIGHLNLFKRAAAEFDELYVALNTDEFIMRYKGKTPVICLEDRIEMISSLECVNGVVVNIGNEDSTAAILVVKPSAIIIGSDWSRTDLMRQMALSEDFLDRNKIDMITYSYTEGISSTKIKEGIER